MGELVSKAETGHNQGPTNILRRRRFHAWLVAPRRSTAIILTDFVNYIGGKVGSQPYEQDTVSSPRNRPILTRDSPGPTNATTMKADETSISST